jgi:hypothetical protein
VPGARATSPVGAAGARERDTRGRGLPIRLGARAASAGVPRGARWGWGPDVEKAGATRGSDDAGAGRTASRASPRSRAPAAGWTPVNACLTARFAKNLNRSAPKGE